MKEFPQRRGPGGRFGQRALLLLAGALLLGWAVMGLWNAVLPAVLPVPALGYGQSLGLLALCRLLLGRWGGRFGEAGPSRRGPAFDKWQRLSADERQQFRQRWVSHRFGPPGEEATD